MRSRTVVLCPETVVLEDMELAGPAISDGGWHEAARESFRRHHLHITILLFQEVLQNLRVVGTRAFEHLVLQSEVELLAVSEGHLSIDEGQADHAPRTGATDPVKQLVSLQPSPAFYVQQHLDEN